MVTFEKLPHVLSRTALSRSQVYALMKKDDFPRPHKLSERAIAWKSEDITAWIESRSQVGYDKEVISNGI